jgi:hypothetical protein
MLVRAVDEILGTHRCLAAPVSAVITRKPRSLVAFWARRDGGGRGQGFPGAVRGERTRQGSAPVPVSCPALAGVVTGRVAP